MILYLGLRISLVLGIENERNGFGQEFVSVMLLVVVVINTSLTTDVENGSTTYFGIASNTSSISHFGNTTHVEGIRNDLIFYFQLFVCVLAYNVKSPST